MVRKTITPYWDTPLFLSLRRWADLIIFEGQDPDTARAGAAEADEADDIDEENDDDLEALRLASLNPAPRPISAAERTPVSCRTGNRRHAVGIGRRTCKPGKEHSARGR